MSCVTIDMMPVSVVSRSETRPAILFQLGQHFPVSCFDSFHLFDELYDVRQQTLGNAVAVAGKG